MVINDPTDNNQVCKILATLRLRSYDLNSSHSALWNLSHSFPVDPESPHLWLIAFRLQLIRLSSISETNPVGKNI